jgi:hypothetical protein
VRPKIQVPELLSALQTFGRLAHEPDGASRPVSGQDGPPTGENQALQQFSQAHQRLISSWRRSAQRL